jgi:signal transduction histidine kinase
VKVPRSSGSHRAALRLAPRLALAMLAVALLSVGAVVLTQWAVATRFRSDLPVEVQLRLREVRRLEGGGFMALIRPHHHPILLPRAGGGVVATGELVTLQDAVRGIGRVQDAQWAGIVAGVVLAALLSTLLALALARTIARPVEAVGGAAKALAGGDLAARVALPPAGFGTSAELTDLARDFNDMAASLERAEGERSAMLADIAHELRTPLTAMTLRLDALRDGLTPLDPQEIERLHRQARRLGRLVEDLRTLSLADAGRLRLEQLPTDLAALDSGGG